VCPAFKQVEEMFSITDSIAEQLTQPMIRQHGAGHRVPAWSRFPTFPLASWLTKPASIA
jgi:hypothetical protein